MHSAFKKAAETQAAVDTAGAVAALVEEVVAMNGRLDRIEALVRELIARTPPAATKGTR